MKLFLIAWLTLTLGACGAGVSEQEINITDGYVLFDSGGKGKMIYHETGNEPYKELIIKPSVVSYQHNDQYLVVLRQPLKSNIDQGEWGTSIQTELELSCEYWIISLKTNDLNGPITEAAYIEKSSEVGILNNELKKGIFNISTFCTE